MRPDGVKGRAFGKVMEIMNTPTYRLALKRLAPGPSESFLELGFGTGKFAAMLLASTESVSVAGVDPSPTMVEVANKRADVRFHSGRADLRVGTVDALPWDTGTFDGVVALHSFQFFSSPELAMYEIQRVLREEGRLLIVLRDHGRHAPAWLPNHISRSGDELNGLIALLERTGFRDIRCGEADDCSVSVLARGFSPRSRPPSG